MFFAAYAGAGNAEESVQSDCGDLIRQGRLQDAVSVCEKLCGQNISSGCSALGSLYSSGKDADLDKARDYLEKACRLDDNISCMDLASLLLFKFNDFDQAVQICNISCGRQVGSACARIGKIYEMDRDYANSVSYYDKACSLKDSDSCLILGIFYLEGKGVKSDAKTANEYFKNACYMGNERGCRHMK